jgi:hypothetical protein
MKDFEFKILLNQRLCDFAEEVLYHYNPCKLVRSEHRCINSDDLTRKVCCTFFHRSKGDPCVFLGKEGNCSFRNVLCKISLCEKAIENADPMCMKTLKLIEDIAQLHGLMRYRWYQ